MKKLVTVISEEFNKDLRGNDTLVKVYPLKSFCVGYDTYFSIEEIDDFVLVNRILNDEELDTLEYLLKNSSIKGILFDDLGILEIVADMSITKILVLDHIATNTSSINYYLEFVDSVVVSSDITREEIEAIVKNASKPVTLMAFGLKKLMYSRRKLLSNYQEYHGLKKENTIYSTIGEKGFLIKEDENGTVFYAKKYYNALELLDLDNVLYFWYDMIGLSLKNAKKILKNEVDVESDTGFLYEASTFRLKDVEK